MREWHNISQGEQQESFEMKLTESKFWKKNLIPCLLLTVYGGFEKEETAEWDWIIWSQFDLIGLIGFDWTFPCRIWFSLLGCVTAYLSLINQYVKLKLECHQCHWNIFPAVNLITGISLLSMLCYFFSLASLKAKVHHPPCISCSRVHWNHPKKPQDCGTHF